MDDVFVRCLPLPTTIKGLTVLDSEGNYNVYLNSRLTYEANRATLQHELQHILNNDFQMLSHVSDIEK